MSLARRDRFLVGGKRLDGEDRTKDLALQDFGACRNIREQRRLVIQPAKARRHTSAAQQPRSLCHRALHETRDARQVLTRDQRSNLRRGVARISKPQLPNAATSRSRNVS